jgi:Na+-transporting methylmalonyl-CoA/oxaloacetate decarboxylase gamma subunit
VDHDLVTSLTVAGIGMVVLFLALTFLYGLMYLMTVFIKDRSKVGKEGQKSREAIGLTAMRQRAAVIAVALASAEHELSTDSAPTVKETVSAWRVLHHDYQLMLNLHNRRVR